MALGTTSHNNYFRGGISLGTLGPSVGPAVLGPRTQQNVTHRIRRREESAPRSVVGPAASRRPAALPERDPPLHVCFGHPHSLTSMPLGEYGDVRQAGSVRP